LPVLDAITDWKNKASKQKGEFYNGAYKIAEYNCRLSLFPSMFKKTILADLTLIKVYGKKRNFSCATNWLAQILVFSIIPPFLIFKIGRKN
jgi:hypothetical protein